MIVPAQKKTRSGAIHCAEMRCEGDCWSRMVSSRRRPGVGSNGGHLWRLCESNESGDASESTLWRRPQTRRVCTREPLRAARRSREVNPARALGRQLLCPAQVEPAHAAPCRACAGTSCAAISGCRVMLHGTSCADRRPWSVWTAPGQRGRRAPAVWAPPSMGGLCAECQTLGCQA